MPDLIGLERLRPAAELEMAAEATEPGPDVLALSSYFRLKRFLDVLAAAAIIILISPIWLVVGAITLLDIATPIFFWQQRLGQGGRPFLLQKFRTLKPPFDWHGREILEAERLSAISCASIDELPQLLNVLVGDMSLIGPRPLLSRDQPPNLVCDCQSRQGLQVGSGERRQLFVHRGERCPRRMVHSECLVGVSFC